jgi:hypothetical protein
MESNTIMWFLIFIGYESALISLVMYGLNMVKFKTNKMFWLSILIPGYLFHVIRSTGKEEKMIPSESE